MIDININKKIGDFNLNVNIKSEKNRLCILGKSGAGKSMLLKCIAGIETPDYGKISISGKELYNSDKGINLSIKDRNTGFLFQSYALFPHMSVEKNILSGAVKRFSKEKAIDKTNNLIEKFGLGDIRNKKASEISGGQKQRTALARAIISVPDILILDEPFSALDINLRRQMEREVRNIIDDFSGTVIIVTHDVEEAYRLSDDIAVIYDGNIKRSAYKDEIFERPVSIEEAVATGRYCIVEVEKEKDAYSPDSIEYILYEEIIEKNDWKSAGKHCFAIDRRDIFVSDENCENEEFINTNIRVDYAEISPDSVRIYTGKVYIDMDRDVYDENEKEYRISIKKESIVYFAWK